MSRIEKPMDDIDIYIEHLCAIIHSQVDELHGSLLNEGSLVSRLERYINLGGYAAEDSLEVIQLFKDIDCLKEMAERLANLQARLVINAADLSFLPSSSEKEEKKVNENTGSSANVLSSNKRV